MGNLNVILLSRGFSARVMSGLAGLLSCSASLYYLTLMPTVKGDDNYLNGGKEWNRLTDLARFKRPCTEFS